MRRALLALVITCLLAACGGSSGSTAVPTQDLGSLEPCAVVAPTVVEDLVGPFLMQPGAGSADASGALTCNYVGAQANVTIVFSTAIMSPDLFATQKRTAVAGDGVPEPGVGDDAFYVLRPAAFNGGLLTVLLGTQTFTVGVQIVPNTQTNPMPDAQFEPTAVAIGKAVVAGLEGS